MNTMTSNKYTIWRNVSFVLHLLSLILLTVCLICVIILFRDLRRFKDSVREKTMVTENYRRTEKVRDENSYKRTRREIEEQKEPYGTSPYTVYEEYEDETQTREPSWKRAASDSTRISPNGDKLTIVTKGDERLLLQTSDGSPWVLLPSLTRISLSTLEDFCFATHRYCANKNEILQTAANHDGMQSSDCDGRCGRRSDMETPSDFGSQTNRVQEPSDFGHVGSITTDVDTGYSTNIDQYTNHIYDGTTPVLTSSTKRRKGLGRKKRRREKCYIQKISVPFLMGQQRTFFGSYMQDAAPREDFDFEKRWLTEHMSGQFLFEYASVLDLKRGGPGDTPVKTYQLPYMYDGTNHLIYNGTLLYQRASSPIIVRYDLRTANYTETIIPGAACKGGDYLYSGVSYNYFDLAADENGIWVFFHYEKSKILSVARLHPKTMRILRTWNLTRFDHSQIGDTWVTCGVMYVLDSRTASNTIISMAYDLFRHRSANVSMPWMNTYNKTSMLSYNPLVKRLLIFDNGYLLERNLLIAYPGKPQN